MKEESQILPRHGVSFALKDIVPRNERFSTWCQPRKCHTRTRQPLPHPNAIIPKKPSRTSFSCFYQRPSPLASLENMRSNIIEYIDDDQKFADCQDSGDSPPVHQVLVDSSTTSARSRPVSPLLTVLLEDRSEQPAESFSNDDNDDDDLAIKLNDQQGFLLFVKIFTLYISRTNDAKNLTRRFKAIVSKCTLENRRGNPDYSPLQQVVQKKLRTELGDVHWNKAQYILHVYCRQNGIHLDTDSF